MSKTAIEGAARTNAFRLNPDEVTIVGLDTSDGPEHPLYDSRIGLPLNRALIDSIAHLGVLETIGIQKDDDGRLLVVYGRQRVRAAREVKRRLEAAGKRGDAELITVPCLSPIKGWTDAEIVSAANAENAIRTADSIEVRAEKAAQLVRVWGGSVTAIGQAAKALGVGTTTINALLSYREAAPEIKEAATSGAISHTAALEVAMMPRKEQAAALKKLTAKGSTTAAEAREHWRRQKAKDGQGSDPPLSRASLLRLSQNPNTDILLGGMTPREILRLAVGKRTPASVPGLLELLESA